MCSPGHTQQAHDSSSGDKQQQACREAGLCRAVDQWAVIQQQHILFDAEQQAPGVVALVCLTITLSVSLPPSLPLPLPPHPPLRPFPPHPPTGCTSTGSGWTTMT